MSRFLATHSKGLPMVHDGLPRTNKKKIQFIKKKIQFIFHFPGTRGVPGSQSLSQPVALILSRTVLCGV